MKILALRGQNIASLSAPFDVSLTEGPLGDAGLFAIAGPTGAGKSTLLDAICLALFDCTPRLQERGGVAVGRADQDLSHRINANDVRGLLSRGAGKGFAEVDFRGTDDRTYRARWEVRRARNKPNGRLQKQDMVLTCVQTGERFGDKKTETLAAIQDKLGLTFEQFKRSAMLAQGDFAAFLHADDRDRADLLERVTGTRIYSDISRASYQRTATEKARYDDLAQQAKNLGRLTPEERRTLMAAHQQAVEAVQAAQAAHTQALSNVEWFVTRKALAHKVTQALSVVEDSERRVTSAQPRRDHLARVIAAAALRLPLSHRNTAKAVLQAIRDEHTMATEQHTRAEAAVLDAQTKEALAQQALRAAIATAEASAPELARAAQLDARIVEATQSVTTAKNALTDAQQQTRSADERCTELSKTVHDITQRAAASRTWLAQHPYAERLATHIDGVTGALAQLAHAQHTATQAATTLPQLERTVAQANQAETTAHTASEQAHNAHEQAVQALKTARQAIASDAREQLDAQKRQHDAQRVQLGQLHEAAAAYDHATRTIADLSRQKTQAEGVIVDQQAVVAERASQVQRGQGQLEEAERALDQTRRALSAEKLRDQLVDGEPCDVCGSTQHPWSDGTVVHQLQQRAQQRVGELKGALAEHTQAMAHASATRDEARRQLDRLAAQLTQAQEARDQAAAQWQRAHSDAAPVPDALPANPDVLADAQAALAQTEASLAATSEALRALEKARDAAQTVVEDALAKRDAAAKQLDHTKAQVRLASDALASCTRRASQAQKDAEAALARLADGLHGRPDWRREATGDPAALTTRLSAEAAAWGTHQAAVRQAEEHLAQAEAGVERAKAQRQSAAAQQEQRHSEFTAAHQHHATLTRERSGLLEGQTVDAVTRTQRARDTESRAQLSQAQQAKNTATTRLAAAQATLTALGKRLSEAAEAARNTHVALERALSEHQVDEPTAQSLLSQPASWVDEETVALASLDRAVDSAKAVHQERLHALQGHDDNAPAMDDDAAQSARQQTERLLQAARDTQAEHKANLKRDDAARAQGEQLDEQLDAQQAVWKDWAAISDVIGSQDGKKFRTFAQGLTLDALLVHANHHLRDLAPRYRLQRVPAEDLALQVIDQDMGDEVRAIPSLSGGETFLSSLALALGLSSLAASETPVESLFIDEGFGTLDRDTLEVALAALDALQASGRQVGLISHVDGLSEHIGVAIHVQKLGAGKSRVVVPDRLATP